MSKKVNKDLNSLGEEWAILTEKVKNESKSTGEYQQNLIKVQELAKNIQSIAFDFKKVQYQRFGFSEVIASDAIHIKDVNCATFFTENEILWTDFIHKPIAGYKENCLKDLSKLIRSSPSGGLFFARNVDADNCASFPAQIMELNNVNFPVMTSRLLLDNFVPIQIRQNIILKVDIDYICPIFLAEREYGAELFYDDLSDSLFQSYETRLRTYPWKRANSFVDVNGFLKQLRSVSVGETVVLACCARTAFHDDVEKLRLFDSCLSFVSQVESKIETFLEMQHSTTQLALLKFDMVSLLFQEGCSFKDIYEKFKLQSETFSHSFELHFAIVHNVNDEWGKIAPVQFAPGQKLRFGFGDGNFHPVMSHFCLSSFREKFSFSHSLNGNAPILQNEDYYIRWHVENRRNQYLIFPMNCSYTEDDFRNEMLYGPDFQFMTAVIPDETVILQSHDTHKKKKHVGELKQTNEQPHSGQSSRSTRFLTANSSSSSNIRYTEADFETATQNNINSEHRCQFLNADNMQCEHKGVVCKHCWSNGLVRVNRYYCDDHMTLHNVNYDQYFWGKTKGTKNSPSSKQTVHEASLLYSSWRSLFRNSPQLCMISGVKTENYPGEFSVSDATHYMSLATVKEVGSCKNEQATYDLLVDLVKNNDGQNFTSLSDIMPRLLREGAELARSQRKNKQGLDSDSDKEVK